MAKKAYKRVVSASMASILSLSSVTLPTAVYAEDVTAEDDVTNATEKEAPTNTEEVSNENTIEAQPEIETVSPESGTAQTDKQEGIFKLSDKDKNPIPAKDATLIFESDSDNSELQGSVETNDNELTFTPESEVDENEKYNYVIKVDGYKDFEGVTTFGQLRTSILAVSMVKEGGEMTFTNTDNDSLIKSSDIVFKDKNDEELDIPTLGSDDDRFDFSSLGEGEIVSYEIVSDGYKKEVGSFTVDSSFVNKDIDLVTIDSVDISDITINKVYGDSEFSLKDKLNLPNDYDGKLSYEITSGKDVVSIDDAGLTSVLESGDANVHVTAPRTDNFAAIDTTIPVRVAKKNLGELTNSMIDWSDASKVYDGKKTLDVEGALNSSAGLVGDDKITVKATATTDLANAGTRNSAVSDIVVSGDLDNYQYTLGLTDGPVVTIDKKEVEVTTSNISAAYGSDKWEAIKKGDLSNYDFSLLTNIETALPDDLQKEFDELNLSDYLTVSVESDNYKVGQYNDKLIVVAKDNATGNFSFKIIDDKGNVTITEDNRKVDDLWSDVTLDFSDSKNFYQDGDTTYVKPGGVLKFDLSSDSVYDKLNIKTDLTGDDYQSSIQIPESAITGDVKGSFYLSDSIDDKTKSPEYDLPANYKIDADVPLVEFLDGAKTFASIFNMGTTTFSDTDQALKFSQANSESGYTLSLNTEDSDSGLKSVKYSLVKVTDDEDAKLKVREAATADDTTWKTVENNQIDIKGTEEGYYIVLVKAKDNVGNEAVYSSNGLVIDTTSPNISVSGLPDLSSVQNKNITYTVDLLDPLSNGVATGITKVDVIVKANGKELSSSDSNTNTFTLLTKDLYGVDEIDTFSDLELAKVAKQFTATIDADSNDVSLEIVAYDKANNKVSSTEYSGIKIDKSKASVSAEYDNTNLNNGKYSSENRKLSLSFNDRNFDEKQAVIHLTVDGIEKDYTIDEIRRGDVEGISLLSDRKDSEADLFERDYTNNRTNSYTFEVGGSGNATHAYSVDASYTKNGETVLADFKNGSSSDEFIIDKTAPEVSIVFNKDDISKDSSNPTYNNKGISASIVVKEDSFDPSDVIVHLTAKDASGKDVKGYSLADFSSLGSWKVDGDTYTFVLDEFTDDANYSLSFEYTDLAGNKAETDTYYFTVDTTAPNGSILVTSPDKSSAYTGLSGKASFQHIATGGIVVSNKASDETSDLASVSYYLYHPSVDAKGEFSVPTAADLAQVNWTEWTGNLTIDANQQVVIYQRIEDKAGNVTYVNSGGAIIADSAAPAEPTINITTPAPANKIYKGDVSASIHVEDQIVGGTYAGLNTVLVEVLNGDSVTQSQTYTVGEKGSRARTFDTNLVVDSRLNNSNFVTIRITAVDWAGNRSTSERQLIIDTVAPRIEVAWDLTDPKNSKYYNATRTATIRVYERNFDPNGIDLSMLGSNAQISGWSTGPAAGVSDDNVNTATITFDADGDYDFALSVTDLAGNTARYDEVDPFTIDKTVPNIKVSWDKDLVNGRYVAGARTATITVTEHNFDADGFTADIKAMLEKQGIPAPSISTWSSNGDVHTATIVFNTDGDFSFTLNFEDLAGNKSEAYSEEEFTVDMTNPEITFEGVEDGSSNRGEVKPRVRFSDINFDKENISLRLKGYRHEEVNVTGSFVDDGNGGHIVLNDFPHDVDTDDIYTLTAEATDNAGNKTTKSITFSVNRFGSNYYFSKSTEKYLDKYYHNEEQNIVIHEVNTDSLKTNGLTIIKDGSTVKLSKDDYTIEEIKDNGWKEYVYTIKASRFEKEGRYEITVDSEDQAGNKQNNKIKEKPASFVIDKTKPSAVITGVENNEIYNALDREVGIKVSDNVLVEDVELLVDGKVVKTFSAEDVSKAKGELSYKLSDSKHWQTLSVKTVDAAGNKATSDEVKVLITPDTTTRTINSLWFKVLAGGGSATLLSGLLWFLLGKRKKDEEEEL